MAPEKGLHCPPTSQDLRWGSRQAFGAHAATGREGADGALGPRRPWRRLEQLWRCQRQDSLVAGGELTPGGRRGEGADAHKYF